MIDIIENAKKHFAQKRSIEVPEWGATIYWTPMSANDNEKIARATKQANGPDTEFAIRLLIEKAEDAEGKKVFTIEHIPLLKSGVDSSVIARVVTAMTTPISLEQAEKN